MTGISVFELVGLREDATSSEIQEKIDETKKRSSRYKDKELFEKIIKALEIYKKRAKERERIEELAQEAPKKTAHLSKDVEDALDYFSTEKEEVPRKKQKKSYKLQKAVIAVGVLAIILTSGSRISENIRERDIQNNVCIEYVVQAGDTFDWVDDNIRDYSTIRTQNVGYNFRYDYLYEGDLIIGRTTMEKARELEEKGYAKIISIDEALDILDATGSSLHGKFREYKENGNVNEAFVFFEPGINYSI